MVDTYEGRYLLCIYIDPDKFYVRIPDPRSGSCIYVHISVSVIKLNGKSEIRLNLWGTSKICHEKKYNYLLHRLEGRFLSRSCTFSLGRSRNNYAISAPSPERCSIVTNNRLKTFPISPQQLCTISRCNVAEQPQKKKLTVLQITYVSTTLL